MTVIHRDELILVVVTAADVESSTQASSSSSVSEGTKSSSASQSSSQKTSNSPQPQSNLPPRLQKKQRQAEEENYMKYYKPMDYMRQTNSYHRKVAADTGTQRAADSARQNCTGNSRRVRDVNTRGSVSNRTLWTDSVANGRSGGAENADSSVQSNAKMNFGHSNTDDTRLSDSTVCEQKPPVTVLTSSSNKLASVEAGVASLNIQSTASNHVMSQPSYAGAVSVSCILCACEFYCVMFCGCCGYITDCARFIICQNFIVVTRQLVIR